VACTARIAILRADGLRIAVIKTATQAGIASGTTAIFCPLRTATLKKRNTMFSIVRPAHTRQRNRWRQQHRWRLVCLYSRKMRSRSKMALREE
jgi:hypothetical protein